MKNKNMTYALLGIAVLLIAAWYTGYLTIPGVQTPNPSPAVTPPPGQISNPQGQATVTKPLKIVATDELAGGNLDGTTNAIKVYDSDGVTLLETLSLSSGSCTTANSYTSGKALWILYYYDTTIDSYKFWQVTVPTMSQADAESLTTNSIHVSTREAGAYTDSLITSGGITITDALEFNCTGTGNDTTTMTYTWYVTSDNTGYPSFHDPIYNLDLKNMIWVTLSGTGYDTLSLTGFDGSFEKGSTMYYYKTVSDNDVSKYKVGNNYVYPGTGSATFGFNAAGFANTTTANPTVQIYLRTYASNSYMSQFGDYGPYDFEAAEQTFTVYTN